MRNNQGQAVPLTALAKFETRSGTEFTMRYNEYRAAQINGSAAPGYSSDQATAALEELPSSEPTEARLAEVKTGIDGCRRVAAQVRAEAQALAREAELADRRLQAITAERNDWQSRKASASSNATALSCASRTGSTCFA